MTFARFMICGWKNGRVSHGLETDTRLSEVDAFNEACAMRLAAQFNAGRNRRRRELDQLVASTQFTKQELKLLYWGWKSSCLSGNLTESTFKGTMIWILVIRE